MSVWRLGIAVVAGATIAGCQLLFGDDPFGGTGGRTSSSSSETGTGAGGSQSDGGPGGGGGSTHGTTVWARTLGNSGDLRVGGVAVDGDGDVYVAGWFQGMVNAGCPEGTLDAGAGTHGYVLKLAADTGSCLWQIPFYGTATSMVTSIVVDSKKNVTVGGGYQGVMTLSNTPASPMAKATDAFITSFAQMTGKEPAWSWSQTWGGSGVDPDGDQLVTSVTLDANDQVYFAGTFTTAFNNTVMVGSNGGTDFFVLHIDPTDANKSAHGVLVGGSGEDAVRAVCVRDPVNDIVAVGSSEGGFSIGSDALPIGLQGNVLSVHYPASFTGPKSALVGDAHAQQARSCAVSSTKDLYVAGLTEGALSFGAGATVDQPIGATAFLVHFDDMGQAVGATSFGASEPVFEPAADVDAGDPDAGDAGAAGGVGTGSAVPVAVGANGVVVAAALKGDVTFPAHSLKQAGAGHNLVVATLSADLKKTVWAKSFGVSGNQRPDGIALDKDGHVIVAGHYKGELDFGASVGKKTSSGINDIFVAKLAP